jgi:membrane protease YdiL (CAAX protease family)
LGLLGGAALWARLMAGAGVSLLIFVVLPLALARGQGIRLRDGFQLQRAAVGLYIAAAVLGATLWPLAYDLIILCRDLGIATLSAERIEEHKSALEELVGRLRALHPLTMLLTVAVVPAIGEELFFRGYLLGALRGRIPAWAAIAMTGFAFGLFHASVFGLVAVERVASSTLLGIALGWLCWTTRSVFPGMVLHAVSNSMMISLMYFADQLKAWGYDAESQRYLPLPLVVISTAVALVAALAIAWRSRAGAIAVIESPAGSQAAGTNIGS